MIGAGLLVTRLALACVTVGILRDLSASLRTAPGGTPNPGLPWIRAGTMGLWAGFAIRLGFGTAEPVPILGLDLIPILAFTAQLHLVHVQGWKGAKVRAAGLWCWAISMAAFGLSFTLPG